MATKGITLSKLASLSLMMSFCFGVSQFAGFLVRLTFRMQLSGEEYGAFAFLLNSFTFFVLLAVMNLHMPIVESISRDPENSERYLQIKAQLFSTSLIVATVAGIIFFVWTVTETGAILPGLIFAFSLVVYATGIVLTSFPRGRDNLKPTMLSAFLTGSARLVLLAFFILGIVFGFDSLSASLIYAVPVLAWWAVSFRHEGIPKLSRPSFSFLKPYFHDSMLSFLSTVATQTPVFLTIVLLKWFYGLEAVGDYDIALLSYSSISIILAGVSYVTVTKARKLPHFRLVIKKLGRLFIIPCGIVAVILLAAAYSFEEWATGILAMLGLPATIYWPAVAFVILAVPTRFLIDSLSGYLQGRGAFRVVAIATASSAAALIPALIILVLFHSMVGAALSIGLINIITLAVLIITALREMDSKEDDGPASIQ